jgi:signal recognition particle subunit SRP54
MFNQLSESLETTFRNLRGLGKISEKNIDDALREVRMSLLEADVQFQATKDFITKVKEQALGEKVLKSVTPGQQIVKIFHDELTALLGGDAAPLNLDPPARILIVGLNGAGKTTTSAKLAAHLKKAGRKPALIALDLFRPAAIDQLETLASQVGVPFFRPRQGETNPVRAAKDALEWLRRQDTTAAIFDTAGRQEVDPALIEELKQVAKVVGAKETLLVADAATGQQAVQVAQAFDEAIGITGIVLTKLDGDARGGAALSMRSATGHPIKFAGTGEKLDALEPFVPDRMAGRILGMGDVVSLVEKAAEAVDEAEVKRMEQRMKKAQFDLTDFLAQMQMMKKMGPLENLLGMIPGMGNMKDLKVDERRVYQLEAIILSMTPKERRRPELINGSRRKRIARGSGTSVLQVNQLLKQFGTMRKMMKKKGGMQKMMSQMGGMGGPGGMPGMGGLPKGMKMPKGMRF